MEDLVVSIYIYMYIIYHHFRKLPYIPLHPIIKKQIWYTSYILLTPISQKVGGCVMNHQDLWASQRQRPVPRSAWRSSAGHRRRSRRPRPGGTRWTSPPRDVKRDGSRMGDIWGTPKGMGYDKSYCNGFGTHFMKPLFKIILEWYVQVVNFI